MSALSAKQIDDVWERSVLSRVRSHYFADLCQRYGGYHRWLLWATLFMSWCSASVVIKDWLPASTAWPRYIIAVATAGLSFWAAVQQFQKRSTDCLDLNHKWNQLANRYDSLWDDVHAEDASSTYLALVEASAEASRASASIPHDPKLMAKWQDHVESLY